MIVHKIPASYDIRTVQLESNGTATGNKEIPSQSATGGKWTSSAQQRNAYTHFTDAPHRTRAVTSSRRVFVVVLVAVVAPSLPSTSIRLQQVSHGAEQSEPQ